LLSVVVVVKRSNGSFCFAKIEKFSAKSGSYDVSLDSGDAKNPASSMKTGLPPKHMGKIAPDPNRLVIMVCLDCKDSLSEQAAVILNSGQAIPFRLRAREVLPLHLALHFLARSKWCLHFCHKTGIETPALLQALHARADQHAATSQSATAFATSDQVAASQRLNLALTLAQDSSAGSLIDLPQVIPPRINPESQTTPASTPTPPQSERLPALGAQPRNHGQPLTLPVPLHPTPTKPPYASSPPPTHPPAAARAALPGRVRRLGGGVGARGHRLLPRPPPGA
jgi:hypothetical protein